SFGRFSVIPKLALHGLWAGTKTFDDKTSHTYFYLRPGIRIDWDINKNNSLRLNYSYNHKNSRVLDNYPNFSLRNFRFLSKGTGAFQQLASSEVFLYYQLGNFMDRFFANAVLLYTKNYDYYSTNTVIRQDFTEENKILIGGEQNFSAHAQGDYFFELISSDLKLNLQYNQHESKNRVNGGGLRSVLYRMLEYGPT